MPPRRNPGPAKDYHHAHQRLRRTVGKASAHLCRCGEQAEEWAYAGPRIEGEDRPWSENPSDYIPMCRACHRLMDAGWTEGPTCPKGHTGEPKTSNRGHRFCGVCAREADKRHDERKASK